MATTKKKTKKKVARKKVTKPDASSPMDVIEQAGSPDSPHNVVQADPMALSDDPRLALDPEFVKFELAKRIALTLANSNLVPDAYRGRANDCFVAINMGRAIGMDEFQAIQSIAVIDGKPSLYGDALIGLVRGSDKCSYIKEWLSDDQKTAYCETLRKGEPEPVTRSYSMQDAMLAGIDSKFNWKKHPKRMLQMRARSLCLRDVYADVLKGLASAEEMHDHEDTPPVITDYQLPDKTADTVAMANAYTEEVTLAEVERAMHQSDSMADLLKAAELAKGLTNPMDQSTARITYKKMRAALMEDE